MPSQNAKKKGITRVAYAKRCGVSRETVRLWERAGYLVVHDDRTIDPDASDRKRSKLLRPKSDSPVTGTTAEQSPDADQVPDINASKARKEAALADLAELKVQEERGRLVDAHEVRRLLYEIAARVRDGVQAIPARHAASLVAITDEHTMRRRLEAACADALRDLDRQVQAFAATVPEDEA